MRPINYRLTANVENLVLQGSADLQGYGNAEANVIVRQQRQQSARRRRRCRHDVSAAPATTCTSSTMPATGDREPQRGQRHGLSRPPIPAVGERGEPGPARQCRPAGLRQQPASTRSTAPAGNNILNGEGGADVMYRRRRQRRLLRRQCQRRGGRESRRGHRHGLFDRRFPAGGQRGNLVLQGSADLQGYGNSRRNAIYRQQPATISSTARPVPTTCSAAPATTSTSSTISATW